MTDLRNVLQDPAPTAWAARPGATPDPSMDRERRAHVVGWARHLDEVREAQRLRYAVFAQEMGARLDTPVAGHDIDRFDDFCEHLLVRDAQTRVLIGTYRVLMPAQARRAGGTYTDGEFDLGRLDALRPHMVELGRSCVHAQHRQGAVILSLWGALAEFMRRNQLHTMVGCASVPMDAAGGLGAGHVAASVWRRLADTYLASTEYRVEPRLPLPVAQLNSSLEVEAPSLIQGYLRMGARVLGAPAWDPDFNTADLPLLLRVQDLPARYQRLFMGQAGPH